MKNLFWTFIKYSFAVICISGISSCLLYHDPPQHDAAATTSGGCAGPEFYEYEFVLEGTYVSPDFTEHTATVHFQNILDIAAYDTFSAKDVAEMSYWAAVAYTNFYLANEPLNLNDPKLVEDMLANSHVIVASEDEQFFWLYGGELYEVGPDEFIEENKKIVAFVRSAGNQCWDIPEEASYTHVYRNVNWFKTTNSWTVAHEMMHMLSLIAVGTSDPEHKQTWLWNKYGDNTVHQETIDLFEAAQNVK